MLKQGFCDPRQTSPTKEKKKMSGFRSAASAAIASIAVLAFAFSGTPTFAAHVYHSHHHRVHTGVGVAVHPYDGSDAYYDEGNEAAFPNTEDHSAECINGYRWQRHNHDWFKTTAEDTMPLPC